MGRRKESANAGIQMADMPYRGEGEKPALHAPGSPRITRTGLRSTRVSSDPLRLRKMDWKSSGLLTEIQNGGALRPRRRFSTQYLPVLAASAPVRLSSMGLATATTAMRATAATGLATTNARSAIAATGLAAAAMR